MSKKTNFKRIALVAVAALGFGVLSAIPSSAAVSAVTLTTTAGATNLRVGGATGTVDPDTGTATGATISLSALITAASDSITVGFFNKSANSGSAGARLVYVDTSTNISRVTTGGLATGANGNTAIAVNGRQGNAAGVISAAAGGFDSVTAGSGSLSYFALQSNSSGIGNVGARFAIILDTATATAGAGTYTWTVLVTTRTQNAGTVVVTEYTADASIVVAAAAAATTDASAATSTVTMFATTGGSAETVVNPALATASTAAAAFFSVQIKNVSSNAAGDTITATVSGPGLITHANASNAAGKSLRYVQSGTVEWSLLPDGNSGLSTVTFSFEKTGQTFTRTVNFYAAKASTIAAVVATPVMKVGSNAAALAVTAKDASGNNWTGSLWVYASSAADALVAGSATPQACGTYGAVVEGVTLCAITGTTLGTAKFKVIDASTVALANATSNEVTVTVSPTAAATVKLAFNKATYAPGEKALITVTPVGADGKNLPEVSLGNLLAAGGITSSVQLGAGSDTLTPVSITTSATSSATANTVAGSKTYVVYMPATGGAVKITATGGTSLPIAGQVEVSATATVTDNAAAALAAVNALATTVASLRTLITTLTNLVLKIQKKVRA